MQAWGKRESRVELESQNCFIDRYVANSCLEARKRLPIILSQTRIIHLVHNSKHRSAPSTKMEAQNFMDEDHGVDLKRSQGSVLYAIVSPCMYDKRTDTHLCSSITLNTTPFTHQNLCFLCGLLWFILLILFHDAQYLWIGGVLRWRWVFSGG